MILLVPFVWIKGWLSFTHMDIAKENDYKVDFYEDV